jgi:hypothetical protein
MHAKDDPRVLRFRDGFWFSRALLRREHAELEVLRVRLSPDSLEEVLHALATVWQVVDAVHRIRELAEAMPGLNKGNAWVRRFLGATATAEEFRNYVQHLREELSKPDVDRFPVWGALSWVTDSDERRIHTAFTGAMLPGTEIRTGAFDSHQGRWVSRVALSVKGLIFNVDPVVEEATTFCDHVLSVIERMQPGLPPLERASWFSAVFMMSDGSHE